MEGATETQKVLIRELSKDVLEDFLNFFDHHAFSDNPWWKGCYCLFLEDPCPDSEWDASEKEAQKHREAKAERISSGKAHGFLAYANGEVVGWCNAAPRAKYVNLRRYRAAVEDPEEQVGSITCFIVRPQFRRKGVATTLLNAACQKFRNEGLTIAEAYPSNSAPDDSDESSWEAENYHGPLEMYLKDGFNVHRQFERFTVVRKRL